MNNQYSNTELDLLKKHQLYILKEFDKIAKKYNIDYFIIAGTLLGAVRHGGFIPWDDDIDLGITRETYNKLKNIDITLENNELKLIDFYTDDYNLRPHAKIALRRTEYIRKNWGKNFGYITVSLFIFDNVSNCEKERIKQYKKHKNLQRLLVPATINTGDRLHFFKESQSNLLKKIVILILSIFLSRKCIVNKIVKNMIKYNDIDTDYVFPFTTFYKYHKTLIPKKWLFPVKYIKFEGAYFPTLNQYENYLIQLYNDYMKLPPIEQRFSKHYHRNIKFLDELSKLD